jgi:hypothetical protein
MRIPGKHDVWMGIAALALHLMFVIYTNLFYIVLTQPIAIGRTFAYPWQVMIIGLFLFGVPGFGLVGATYLLARRLARREMVRRVPSMIILAQGIILIAGMVNASSIVPNINQEYRLQQFEILPQIFIAGGVAIIAFAIHLYTIKPIKKFRRSNEM